MRKEQGARCRTETDGSAAARPYKPWYREPWPWLLMSGPALVVVAACYTLWLAVSSNDGLVDEDYYTRGLAINQVLTREHAAAAGHYRARVMLDARGSTVRVILSGATLPDALALRLVHATREGLDRSVRLVALGSGLYEGRLAPPSRGRWGVRLEDQPATWRLTGEWQLPAEAPLTLAAH